MAEATIALGAVLDIATGREVRDLGDALLRRLEHRGATSIRRNAVGLSTGAGAQNSYLAIDCGGPAAGRIWDVRSLSCTAVIGGVLDGFAATAQLLAMFLVTAAAPANGMFDASWVATSAANVPFDRKFGKGQLPILAPEHLWCWVKITGAGGLANANVIAGFSAIEASVDSDLMEDL